LEDEGGWNGAHQLLHSNDAQSGTVWSPDGKWIVFKQDKGGDEMYDLYRVSSDGGTAANLTNTDQTREENAVFSKQGGWLAFDSKRKADPGSNIAVLKQNSQTPKLLTHADGRTQLFLADPKTPRSQEVTLPAGINSEVGDLPAFHLTAVSCSYRIKTRAGRAIFGSFPFMKDNPRS
jgi:dipeptidyl aminopeptidase/acylaminoacyl peptidase